MSRAKANRVALTVFCAATAVEAAAVAFATRWESTCISLTGDVGAGGIMFCSEASLGQSGALVMSAWTSGSSGAPILGGPSIGAGSSNPTGAGFSDGSWLHQPSNSAASQDAALGSATAVSTKADNAPEGPATAVSTEAGNEPEGSATADALCCLSTRCKCIGSPHTPYLFALCSATHGLNVQR